MSENINPKSVSTQVDPTDLLKHRADLRFIADRIGEGERVLDLGCGNAALLAWIRDKKGCEVYGVEIDQGRVIEALSKGVPVLCHDMDDGLSMFPDKSFDTVVLSDALMQVQYPSKLVEEMLRIGKKIIVGFPNFANWRIRTYLLFKGRMPVNSSVPYTWHETPNIHHTTVLDFKEFLVEHGAHVRDEYFLKANSDGSLTRITRMPNLRAKNAIFVADNQTR